MKRLLRRHIKLTIGPNGESPKDNNGTGKNLDQESDIKTLTEEKTQGLIRVKAKTNE